MSLDLSFDPILYLNIKITEKDKEIFSQKIMDQLSEYLAIRLIELLPEKEIENIDSPLSFFHLAKQRIPNLEEKVKVLLEEFKQEIYKEI